MPLKASPPCYLLCHFAKDMLSVLDVSPAIQFVALLAIKVVLLFLDNKCIIDRVFISVHDQQYVDLTLP